MDAALSHTVEYLKDRRQFGRAIGSFQAVQHRLAECAIEVEASRWLVREAADRQQAAEAVSVAAAFASGCLRPLVRRDPSVEWCHWVYARARSACVEHAAARSSPGTRWRAGAPTGRGGRALERGGRVSLDLDFDLGQSAVAEAVAQFCSDHCPDELVRAAGGSFPREPWQGLAELGVFWAAAPDEEAGALELCAAVEALGRAVFPGPLAATCVAVHALPEPERTAVAEGRELVALGESPMHSPVGPDRRPLPWSTQGDRLYRAEPVGPIEALETLGGDPWGRVELRRGELMSTSREALVLGEIVGATYLAAAGRRLLKDAAQHALVRKQFGRSIGEFQAVAHPLADCWMRLDAARGLARQAAWAFDSGAGEAAQLAAVARLSAAGRRTRSGARGPPGIRCGGHYPRGPGLSCFTPNSSVGFRTPRRSRGPRAGAEPAGCRRSERLIGTAGVERRSHAVPRNRPDQTPGGVSSIQSAITWRGSFWTGPSEEIR